ncbi:MAG: hypothetical protein KKC20_03735 [Proteobacteria bacterium]|nr:hypothetical protein [Pseudomonadota bacterium]
MSDEFITLELARIYESQGYFRDALDMYRALEAEEEDAQEGEKDVQARDLEIAAGLLRMESALKKQDSQADPRENPLEPLAKALASLAEPREPLADHFSADSLPEKGISPLLEQWLMLLMLEKRVNSMKQLKSGAFGLTP